jgi:hypothetical protein
MMIVTFFRAIREIVTEAAKLRRDLLKRFPNAAYE